ncbi:hypothetical protein ARMSODRAFT_968147 [Armillaria solidipes]|uniref:Uncharacterized protein n=1 Tax=Armillaria solidipes TaxID=1076256 RepID=A0A2H3CHI3_9AGAR|nr:hypothetical protein ARMSODRAFT_968147 [Armillaria solidipes]
MTSTPVLESTNRYTILTTEDNDNDLCPWDDRCDAGDAAATTGRSSRWESGGGDPVVQGTTWALKSKQPSPLLLGPVRENLKGPSQSPARAQEKAANPAGHRAESPINNDAAGAATFPPPSHSRGIELIAPSDPPRPEETGRTNKSVFAARVQPNVPYGDVSSQAWQIPPPDTQKENKEDPRKEATTDTNQRMGDAPTRHQTTGGSRWCPDGKKGAFSHHGGSPR